MQPAAAMRQLDPLGTFDRLREAFFRYYETPFALADPALEQERHDLLDRDGGVYRLPLIELRPEYATAAHELAESVAAAGAPHELAEFAATGLIPAGRTLYRHQEDALTAGMRAGEHMVITAGTGSGKTESFLLPVLASLLEESRDWTGAPAPAQQPPWWQSDDDPFVAQRDGETGRPQAVRALVLYPMNALVDDQLTRLRKALDSDAARAWLDEHRAGHRFYFGRYTGATPVTGTPGNNLAVRDLRRYLRDIERRGHVARQLSAQPGREDTQYFVPRLDGAEMRSRWDMSAAPPDILITNYSMLNVMLLRERDGHFFDSTRQWLDDDPRRRFTLVVDELHMYRGTPGTEVGYLLRALKHRLGLSERPEQLRILAASASLDPHRDADYLQDFFGVPSTAFTFIPGEPAPIAAPGRAVTAAEMTAISPPAAADLARTANFDAALRLAFVSNDPRGTASEALSPTELASRLFPETQPEAASAATRQLLRGLAESPAPGDPKLRAHMFFRNVPGVWACTDPTCPDIPSGGHQDRTVGRLFAEPTTRCTCGARVLELLYCQACGDVLLGGFAPENATQAARIDALLLADIPELAKLPDQVKLDRTAANYLVYWPRAVPALTEVDRANWTRDGGAVSYTFRRSRFEPGTGALTNDNNLHTGWSFHVTVARAGGAFRRDPTTLSPYPTKCPACGDDWEIQYGAGGRRLPHTDPLTQRSPIRGMRTGFEKINQVLTTELATDLPPEERKLIVFTDSRQDAAKLSSGLALRHYQDLLRLLLNEQLQRTGDPRADVAAARAHIVDGVRTEASWEAIRRLQERDRAAFDRLRDIWEGAPGTRPEDEPVAAAPLSRAPSLTELSGAIAADLLAMGMNPGGPAAGLQHAGTDAGPRWTTLYDWTATPPLPRGGLGPDQQALQQDINSALVREVLEGLFSGAGRDFESLGLGWLALADDDQPADAPANTPTGLARAALRIIAGLRRFNGMRDGRPDPPPKLRKLWEAIENAGGPDVASLTTSVANRWGTAVIDYVVDPSRVVLRPPTSDSWICTGCRRQHLTRGCGRCTHCRRPLPDQPGPVQRGEDYYSWKATNADGRFRLNCAELTGQTDRVDAQGRQSRFQGVFLDRDENELADGVDLLSVTTTMEAGVDIGALSAVVLGNMPPTRFNYQQRVGRAGRRESPVAVALTVCRGRSHDEYYFDRPEAITNEPTPRPYVAMGRAEIFRRSLNSDVLRLAMRDIGPSLAARGIDLDLTANVHGAFGLTADWPVLRGELQGWLHQNGPSVAASAAALADHTPLAPIANAEAAACAGGLIAAIDEAVASAAGHAELSQRLAEHGVLPMFGFPSSVRYLHLNRPRRAYPWPPAGVIDRDLAMAVAQFSPLSEIVRDGKVHPVVGITAFRPTRPTPTPDPEPLGPGREISLCRSCSFLDEAPLGTPQPPAGNPCPRCGAGPDYYASMPLREPLGFRAGRPHDFDGNFAWAPRAMAARAATDLATLAAVQLPAATCYAGRGRRFVINDNSGELFALRPAAPGGQDWGGFVSVAAIDRDLLHPNSAAGDPVNVALGAVQPTDFMFLGPNNPVDISAGRRLNLGMHRQPSGARDPAEGRRGAWYSLAFLLRTAAASFLDVQPLELTAGVYAGLSGTEPAAYAFIADTLENGAGFSTHLGTSAVLPELLDHVQTFLAALELDPHARECAASCYRCLRDYGNMAYHALLDWRLARDLFSVLRGAEVNIDLAAEKAALNRWATSYGAVPLDGLPAATAAFSTPLRGTYIVIARHPLEASEATIISPRLAEACAFAEAATPNAAGTVFIDTFTLDRDPRRVIEMCDEALQAP